MRGSRRKKYNTIIGGLSAILLIMTVGYAAFYSQLKISGTSSITTTWDIEITNVESKNIVGSASNKEEPTYEKLTANFSTNLVSPGDSITYDITVENKGNVNATLDKINLNKTDNPAITFTTSGLVEGGTLETGKSAVLSVKVAYDSSVTSQPDNLISTLKVTLDFVQHSGDIIPIEPDNSVYVVSSTPMYIGQTIPSDVTVKTNPLEAMADWANISSANNNVFLKHVLVDNKVSEAYVGFVITEEIAKANDGIVAGTYYLKGGSDSYDSNVETIKKIFDYDNHKDRCHIYDYMIICTVDSYIEIYQSTEDTGGGLLVYDYSTGYYCTSQPGCRIIADENGNYFSSCN